MISVEQADQRLSELECAPQAEEISLESAFGRVLYSTVLNDRDQPPYDRVCMDGFAVRSADGLLDLWSPGGIAQAGVAQHSAPLRGHCIEVMTGAVAPVDCDLVVRVEDVERQENGIRILKMPRPGANIQPKGTDAWAGSPALNAGSRIGPCELAILASLGKTKVEVFAHPKIAMLSTGDELVDIGNQPLAHQIRRSNGWAVDGALRGAGLTGAWQTHLPDEEQELSLGVSRALQEFDVVLLSGGVSMGRWDLVPGVLKSLGVKELFHKIAQKPGKPLWVGLGPRGQWVAGLPGNPVSALVCFVRYILPALRRRSGLPPAKIQVGCSQDLARLPKMTRYVPCQISGLVATPTPGNGSGDFLSLANTHGFMEIPGGDGVLPTGTPVEFFPWW